MGPKETDKPGRIGDHQIIRIYPPKNFVVLVKLKSRTLMAGKLMLGTNQA